MLRLSIQQRNKQANKNKNISAVTELTNLMGKCVVNKINRKINGMDDSIKDQTKETIKGKSIRIPLYHQSINQLTEHLQTARLGLAFGRDNTYQLGELRQCGKCIQPLVCKMGPIVVSHQRLCLERPIFVQPSLACNMCTFLQIQIPFQGHHLVLELPLLLPLKLDRNSSVTENNTSWETSMLDQPAVVESLGICLLQSYSPMLAGSNNTVNC